MTHTYKEPPPPLPPPEPKWLRGFNRLKAPCESAVWLGSWKGNRMQSWAAEHSKWVMVVLPLSENFWKILFSSRYHLGERQARIVWVGWPIWWGDWILSQKNITQPDHLERKNVGGAGLLSSPMEGWLDLLTLGGKLGAEGGNQKSRF